MAKIICLVSLMISSMGYAADKIPLGARVCIMNSHDLNNISDPTPIYSCDGQPTVHLTRVTNSDDYTAEMSGQVNKFIQAGYKVQSFSDTVVFVK